MEIVLSSRVEGWNFGLGSIMTRDATSIWKVVPSLPIVNTLLTGSVFVACCAVARSATIDVMECMPSKHAPPREASLRAAVELEPLQPPRFSV